MSEFCVSVFTEKRRIINSRIFNYSTYEELIKELDNILHKRSYGKLPRIFHPNRSEVVKEYISEKIRWVYIIHPKKNDVVKYFLIIERKK